MLSDALIRIYNKFRLVHYRSIFSRIQEIEGSLSATEAYAADVIHLLKNPTIKQFSDYLGISQPNATYKVNSLVGKGYVTREPSNGDKREFRLQMSEKFYRYYDSRSQFILDAVKKLKNEYSAEELNLFETMLNSLEKSIQLS